MDPLTIAVNALKFFTDVLVPILSSFRPDRSWRHVEARAAVTPHFLDGSVISGLRGLTTREVVALHRSLLDVDRAGYWVAWPTIASGDGIALTSGGRLTIVAGPEHLCEVLEMRAHNVSRASIINPFPPGEPPSLSRAVSRAVNASYGQDCSQGGRCVPLDPRAYATRHHLIYTREPFGAETSAIPVGGGPAYGYAWVPPTPPQEGIIACPISEIAKAALTSAV